MHLYDRPQQKHFNSSINVVIPKARVTQSDLDSVNMIPTIRTKRKKVKTQSNMRESYQPMSDVIGLQYGTGLNSRVQPRVNVNFVSKRRRRRTHQPQQTSNDLPQPMNQLTKKHQSNTSLSFMNAPNKDRNFSHTHHGTAWFVPQTSNHGSTRGSRYRLDPSTSESVTSSDNSSENSEAYRSARRSHHRQNTKLPVRLERHIKNDYKSHRSEGDQKGAPRRSFTVELDRKKFHAAADDDSDDDGPIGSGTTVQFHFRGQHPKGHTRRPDKDSGQGHSHYAKEGMKQKREGTNQGSDGQEFCEPFNLKDICHLKSRTRQPDKASGQGHSHHTRERMVPMGGEMEESDRGEFCEPFNLKDICHLKSRTRQSDKANGQDHHTTERIAPMREEMEDSNEQEFFEPLGSEDAFSPNGHTVRPDMVSVQDRSEYANSSEMPLMREEMKQSDRQGFNLKDAKPPKRVYRPIQRPPFQHYVGMSTCGNRTARSRSLSSKAAQYKDAQQKKKPKDPEKKDWYNPMVSANNYEALTINPGKVATELMQTRDSDERMLKRLEDIFDQIERNRTSIKPKPPTTEKVKKRKISLETIQMLKAIGKAEVLDSICRGDLRRELKSEICGNRQLPWWESFSRLTKGIPEETQHPPSQHPPQAPCIQVDNQPKQVPTVAPVETLQQTPVSVQPVPPPAPPPTTAPTILAPSSIPQVPTPNYPSNMMYYPANQNAYYNPHSAGQVNSNTAMCTENPYHTAMPLMYTAQGLMMSPEQQMSNAAALGQYVYPNLSPTYFLQNAYTLKGTGGSNRQHILPRHALLIPTIASSSSNLKTTRMDPNNLKDPTNHIAMVSVEEPRLPSPGIGDILSEDMTLHSNTVDIRHSLRSNIPQLRIPAEIVSVNFSQTPTSRTMDFKMPSARNFGDGSLSSWCLSHKLLSSFKLTQQLSNETYQHVRLNSNFTSFLLPRRSLSFPCLRTLKTLQIGAFNMDDRSGGGRSGQSPTNAMQSERHIFSECGSLSVSKVAINAWYRRSKNREEVQILKDLNPLECYQLAYAPSMASDQTPDVTCLKNKKSDVGVKIQKNDTTINFLENMTIRDQLCQQICYSLILYLVPTLQGRLRFNGFLHCLISRDQLVRAILDHFIEEVLAVTLTHRISQLTAGWSISLSQLINSASINIRLMLENLLLDKLQLMKGELLSINSEKLLLRSDHQVYRFAEQLVNRILQLVPASVGSLIQSSVCTGLTQSVLKMTYCAACTALEWLLQQEHLLPPNAPGDWNEFEPGLDSANASISPPVSTVCEQPAKLQRRVACSELSVTHVGDLPNQELCSSPEGSTMTHASSHIRNIVNAFAPAHTSPKTLVESKYNTQVLLDLELDDVAPCSDCRIKTMQNGLIPKSHNVVASDCYCAMLTSMDANNYSPNPVTNQDLTSPDSVVGPYQSMPGSRNRSSMCLPKYSLSRTGVRASEDESSSSSAYQDPWNAITDLPQKDSVPSLSQKIPSHSPQKPMMVSCNDAWRTFSISTDRQRTQCQLKPLKSTRLDSQPTLLVAKAENITLCSGCSEHIWAQLRDNPKQNSTLTVMHEANKQDNGFSALQLAESRQSLSHNGRWSCCPSLRFDKRIDPVMLEMTEEVNPMLDSVSSSHCLSSVPLMVDGLKNGNLEGARNTQVEEGEANELMITSSEYQSDRKSPIEHEIHGHVRQSPIAQTPETITPPHSDTSVLCHSVVLSIRGVCTDSGNAKQKKHQSTEPQYWSNKGVGHTKCEQTGQQGDHSVRAGEIWCDPVPSARNAEPIPTRRSMQLNPTLRTRYRGNIVKSSSRSGRSSGCIKAHHTGEQLDMRECGDPIEMSLVRAPQTQTTKLKVPEIWPKLLSHGTRSHEMGVSGAATEPFYTCLRELKECLEQAESRLRAVNYFTLQAMKTSNHNRNRHPISHAKLCHVHGSREHGHSKRMPNHWPSMGHLNYTEPCQHATKTLSPSDLTTLHRIHASRSGHTKSSTFCFSTQKRFRSEQRLHFTTADESRSRRWKHFPAPNMELPIRGPSCIKASLGTLDGLKVLRSPGKRGQSLPSTDAQRALIGHLGTVLRTQKSPTQLVRSRMCTTRYPNVS